DFFNFEGGDSVAQDVAHVRAVPIEAFDPVQHDPSIYGECIYTQQQEAFRTKTKNAALWRLPPPAPVRTNRCARPANGPRCAPCGFPHPGRVGLPAFRWSMQ